MLPIRGSVIRRHADDRPHHLSARRGDGSAQRGRSVIYDCIPWPPYVIWQAIIFLPCGFFFSIFVRWNTGRKKSPSGRHRTILSGYIFAIEAHIDNREKIVKQQCLRTCPHNVVNFGPLAAEIASVVWGTPANVNGFHVLAALLHGTPVVGISQTAVLYRGRHLYLAGRPSRWASAHILVLYLCCIICVSAYFCGILLEQLIIVFGRKRENGNVKPVFGRSLIDIEILNKIWLITAFYCVMFSRVTFCRPVLMLRNYYVTYIYNWNWNWNWKIIIVTEVETEKK